MFLQAIPILYQPVRTFTSGEETQRRGLRRAFFGCFLRNRLNLALHRAAQGEDGGFVKACRLRQGDGIAVAV